MSGLAQIFTVGISRGLGHRALNSGAHPPPHPRPLRSHSSARSPSLVTGPDGVPVMHWNHLAPFRREWNPEQTATAGEWGRDPRMGEQWGPIAFEGGCRGHASHTPLLRGPPGDIACLCPTKLTIGRDGGFVLWGTRRWGAGLSALVRLRDAGLWTFVGLCWVHWWWQQHTCAPPSVTQHLLHPQPHLPSADVTGRGPRL